MVYLILKISMKKIFLFIVFVLIFIAICFTIKLNNSINNFQNEVKSLSQKTEKILEENDKFLRNNTLNFLEEPNINKLISLDKEQLECLNIAVLGEHSKSTDKEIESFIYWFMNQAKKNNRDLCEEFHSRAAGGALKYSSATIEHLFRITQESEKIKERVSNIIKQTLENFDEEKYEVILKMDNYLTLELATSKKAPKWHKEHLVDYVIIDNTFYGKYNWNTKTKVIINFK